MYNMYMFMKTNINMYTNMYIVQYKYVQYMNNLKMNTNIKPSSKNISKHN